MNKIILFLFSVSFGAYIGFDDIDNISSYLVLFILPFFLAYHFKMARVIKKGSLTTLLLYTMSFFIAFTILSNILNGLSPLSGVFWWLVFFILLMTEIDKDEIVIAVNIFTLTSIIALSIDAYYRFFISTKNLEYGFYAYKYGLIGVDSNFAGLFSMLVAITYDQIIIKKEKKSPLKILTISIVIILLISTFSRAAIIGISVYLLLHRINMKCKYILILALLIASTLYTNNIESLTYQGDESGNSKLNLINEYTTYFFNSSIDDIIFGYGLGELKVGNYNPHLLPLQLLTGYGVIGLVLYISVIASILIKYNATKVIIIPYLIVSMSVAPIGVGVLTFTLYALIRFNDDNRMLLRR